MNTLRLRQTRNLRAAAAPTDATNAPSPMRAPTCANNPTDPIVPLRRRHELPGEGGKKAGPAMGEHGRQAKACGTHGPSIPTDDASATSRLPLVCGPVPVGPHESREVAIPQNRGNLRRFVTVRGDLRWEGEAGQAEALHTAGG